VEVFVDFDNFEIKQYLDKFIEVFKTECPHY